MSLMSIWAFGESRATQSEIRRRGFRKKLPGWVYRSGTIRSDPAVHEMPLGVVGYAGVAFRLTYRRYLRKSSLSIK
jgi:hypothetical protein